MSRGQLLQAAAHVLSRAGFFVTPVSPGRPLLLDLVARRDDEVWLVKVLQNVDGVQSSSAEDLLRLAGALEGQAIVLGHHSGQGPLEPGVLYRRHGVPVVSMETFEAWMLAGCEPVVEAAPGGYYVHIDGATVREARDRLALSLGDVAHAIGVSRRAVQMYEQGMRALVEVALHLEEVLETELVIPAPVTRPEPPDQDREREPDLGDPLLARLRSLHVQGWSVMPTRRMPFQAVTRAEETFLTLSGTRDADLGPRVRISDAVARVAEREIFAVVERRTRTNIRGVPVVTREEVEAAGSPDELDRILSKRRGPRT